MSLLTEQQLKDLDAARGISGPCNIILHGQLRRCSIGCKRSFLHRSSRKVYVVLDDTKLSCYESEIDWHLGLLASHQITLDSISAVECSQASIEIVYTSEWSQVQDRVKFTSSNRGHFSHWREILPLCLPGSRSMRSFASELGLSLKSSVREIIDRLASAFPQILAVRCIQPKCPSSPRPLIRISSFYKRIIADHQFRVQVGGIQRLLQRNHVALEKAILDELLDTNNDETLRRDALIVLWNVCSCSPLRSCQTHHEISCRGCILGAQKFLFHISRSPDLVISEGLLDVLLQRTANNSGDCRVKRPRAWPALFSILAAVSAEHRQRLLRTINFLLIDNEYNCRTLAAQTGWQHMIYSAMVADRAGIDMIVALSLNILVIMSYYALVNTDNFICMVNETLKELQLNDNLAVASVQISRIYLISLSNKIAANMKSFSAVIDSRPWTQSFLFSKVVLRFMFREIEGENISHYRRRNSFEIANIAERLRHRKDVLFAKDYIDLFCVRDKSGNSGDDVMLAEKITSLYDQLLHTIRDPTMKMDVSRNPGLIEDAELIRDAFRQIIYKLRDDTVDSDNFRELISTRSGLHR